MKNDTVSGTEKLLQTACRAAEEKKAINLRVLDLRGLASFTDFFVFCHGQSDRQVNAIVDHIEEELKKEHSARPYSIEGYQKADWILMDYSDFVVHVFSEERREFFGLERLWSDAPRLDPAREKDQPTEAI